MTRVLESSCLPSLTPLQENVQIIMEETTTRTLESSSLPCVSNQKGLMGLSMFAFKGAVLCRMPNGKAEGDLVNHIGEVVHQIESTVLYGTLQIAEKVTKRVDGPANCDDETHGAERGLHVLVGRTQARRASFTREDLEQDDPC